MANFGYIPQSQRLQWQIGQEQQKLPWWMRAGVGALQAWQKMPWFPAQAQALGGIGRGMEWAGEKVEEYVTKPAAGALTMPWAAMADPEDPGAKRYREDVLSRIEGKPPFEAMRALGIGTPGGLTTPFLPGTEGRKAYEEWEAPKYLRGAVELGVELPLWMAGGAAFSGTKAGAAVARGEAWFLNKLFGKPISALRGLLSRTQSQRILGVGPKATQAEIKRAFRRQAFKWHPDINKSANAADKFNQVTAAYQKLTGTTTMPKYKPVGPIKPTGKEVVPFTEAKPIPPVKPLAVAPTANPTTPIGSLAQVEGQMIATNNLDKASSAFMEKGNLVAMADNMPNFAKMTAAEAKAIGMATKLTPAGKEVPAQRKSGFAVDSEFADYKDFKNISEVKANSMDTTTMFITIDGGNPSGMAQKHIEWPTRRTVMARNEWSDGNKGLADLLAQEYGLVGDKHAQQAVTYVMEHLKGYEKAAVADMLANPDIAKIVARYPQQMKENIVTVAQQMRANYDDIISEVNTVRTKRQQSAIPYRENYVPWVVERNIWGQLFGLKKTPADVMKSAQLPDFIKPAEVKNPRALERLGGLAGYRKERNYLKLWHDYVDVVSKDVFNTNILHNAKIHATVLRSQGYDGAASSIEEWAAKGYAGVLPGIERGIRRGIPMQLLRPLHQLRRSLTMAVFPLNWTWNSFIQTSSLGLTYARYGEKNLIKGKEYATNPQVRARINKNAYSQHVKGRLGGQVAFQDIGTGTSKALHLEASKFDKVVHYSNYLTHKIEQGLTGVSIWAAYQDGLSKGMKEGSRELWEYASNGGALTQSMYNIEDVPGVLTRTVGSIAPFQTFSFQVFNTAREILGKVGYAKTGKDRVKMLLRWVGAMVVTNMVVDKAINRKPWTASSFIPFWAILTGGMNAGNPWNQPLPIKYTQDLNSGIGDVIRHGNFKRLRGWAIKYHALGGMQVERMLDGIEAVAKGGVYDVAGRKMYDVLPSEAPQAISMGPYATVGGREYIEKMQEAKGPLYEQTGIPIPVKKKEKPTDKLKWISPSKVPTKTEEPTGKLKWISP